MGFVKRGWCSLGVIAYEIGGKEIEGQRKPENPFVVLVKAAPFLLGSAMFVKELHPDIEPPVLWGSFLLHHLI